MRLGFVLGRLRLQLFVQLICPRPRFGARRLFFSGSGVELSVRLAQPA